MNTDDKFISITISFPKDMIAYLDEEAGKHDRNRSQIVRESVRERQERQKQQQLELEEGEK